MPVKFQQPDGMLFMFVPSEMVTSIVLLVGESHVASVESPPSGRVPLWLPSICAQPAIVSNDSSAVVVPCLVVMNRMIVSLSRRRASGL